MREASSDRLQPVRDLNGFRKLLLLLTRTGALTALHNGERIDGRGG